MAGTRRLVAAVLVALAIALVGVTVAAAPGGTTRGVVPSSDVGDEVLQPLEAQPALTPAKRELGEHLTVVVLAVLTVAAGLGAPPRNRFFATRRLSVAPGTSPLAVRLRGPPFLSPSSPR